MHTILRGLYYLGGRVLLLAPKAFLFEGGGFAKQRRREFSSSNPGRRSYWLGPTGCGSQRLLRALNGTRILLATAPASLPCTPLFVAMRHLPPTGGSLCSLAAVSSAAIPVRVKLKTPLRIAAAATTLDIPTGRDLQQRRPRPVADAGRSCWGSGQQDARAAQGTRGCWEPQPEALKKSPVGSFCRLRRVVLFDSRAGCMKQQPH